MQGGCPLLADWGVGAESRAQKRGRVPYGAGALVRPLALFPQHVIVPALRNAHVCPPPPLTAVKLPVGAVVWPWLLRPQHVTAPVLSIAQLW